MADCSITYVLDVQSCCTQTSVWVWWWRCKFKNSLFIRMPLEEINTKAGLICTWRTQITFKIHVAFTVSVVNHMPLLNAWWIDSLLLLNKKLLILFYDSNLCATEIRKSVWAEESIFSKLIVLSGCWPVYSSKAQSTSTYTVMKWNNK